MLRALSSYYYKEAGMLFLVRVSQGLVHLGKGLLGLAPYHTDGQLLSGMLFLGYIRVASTGPSPNNPSVLCLLMCF